MVLFDDVVEVLVLAHQDINTGVDLEAFNCGRGGNTLVDGDPCWHVVQVDGAFLSQSSSENIFCMRRSSA